jgi:hypothetical protein
MPPVPVLQVRARQRYTLGVPVYADAWCSYNSAPLGT